MKYIIIFLSLVISIHTSAQNSSTIKTEDCPDCKIDCMCKLFFDTLLSKVNKRVVIKDNWNDFFAKNMETDFPIHKGIKVVSVKFDGLGCIYPENTFSLNQIGNDFLDVENVSHKDFNKESFQRLYKKNLNGVTNINIDAFVTQTGINVDSMQVIDSKTGQKDIDYFKFIKAWNAKFLKDKVVEINQNISGIKRIVIFIHGYNVPYSLAHLQGNAIAETMLEEDKSLTADQILFIRIFWPSGYLKRSDFEETSCDYSNIEKPETMWSYTYISNGAYLSAIGLRSIISQIGGDLPINIITHSHGATLATTALINTESKLQKGGLSEKIAEYMKKVGLPSKKINVFLNAPAIPGESTFCDIRNTSIQNKYYFFVGYNMKDQVLLKQKLKGKGVKWIKPTSHLSSTTLGCNKRNEVFKTEDIFKKEGMPNNFRYGINSNQTEHDFFCYIKQKEFKANLKLFLQLNKNIK